MCRVSMAGLVALVFALSASVTAEGANPQYAGYQSTDDHNHVGIRGYLHQYTSDHVSTGLWATWINLCAAGSCAQWAQTGTYQGSFAGGTSRDEPHMYYENRDPCGDYVALDIGAPPSANYFYSLKWTGDDDGLVHCNNAIWNFYTYGYKKGSSGATPFFVGHLSTPDGIAGAKTEWQADSPLAKGRFGCNGTDCFDSAYGIEIYDTTWHLWTGNVSTSDSQPLDLGPINNYWSFKTCPYPC